MRQSVGVMAPSSRDLLLAYRWPVAVVLSAVVLSCTGLRLLSRPIPIAIKGGLEVDKLVLPPSVMIRTDAPLPVRVEKMVTITGTTPLEIKGPLTVREIQGAVRVKADAQVSGIDAPIKVTAAQPLPVRGEVSVNDDVTIKGKVTVDGKVGAKVKPTLLPMPLN